MIILDNVDSIGEIDFLCNLMCSVTSIDQPGNGSLVIIAAEKWTYDTRLLSIKTQYSNDLISQLHPH